MRRYSEEAEMNGMYSIKTAGGFIFTISRVVPKACAGCLQSCPIFLHDDTGNCRKTYTHTNTKSFVILTPEHKDHHLIIS